MKKILIIMSILMMSAAVVSAQEDKSEDKDYPRGWYIGAQGALSMGEGDFSSFGADKFRAGGNGGMFGGYRFDKVWSLELNAHWGGLNMAEQQCCFERGYWINPTTWERFRDRNFPKSAEGYYYKDLMSRTFVQQYSLQANMNILGFFNVTRDSRWMLEVSPMVSAVGTSSDILAKEGKNSVRENISQWHLGAGGAIQVSYAVTKQLNVGIYGDFTHLFNEPLDGMPELHSTNFMIDAGVRLSWNFGSKKRAKKSSAAVVPAVIAPVVPTEQPKEDVKEVVVPPVEKVDSVVAVSDTPKEVVAADTVAVQPTEEVVVTEQPKEEVKDVAATTVVADSTQFPVIYFSFNSVWIEPAEKAKIRKIADVMKANPEMRVRITGWGDEVGGEEANKRVSLQRAEAVKRMLGKWLIPAERVETVGAGINRTAQNETEARNATTIEITE